MKVKNFVGRVSGCAFISGLILLPFQVNALDLTPDASRVISDPAYLPLQGQIYGTTAYTYGEITSDADNNLGVKTGSPKTRNSLTTQSFAYGVTDDFTIRVTDSYEFSKTDTNPTSGANVLKESDGFTDPTVGATWRALDQKQYPVSFDIIGSYTPDVFNAKSATADNNGTVARGGQEATGGVAISYKTKDFTIYGEGTATYLGSRDSLNESNDVTTNTNSSWQYAANLQTQTRLTDWFSVNLGVTETYSNNYDATNSGTLVTFTHESGDITSLNGALNFQLIPDRLVAGLTYAHDFYGNSSNNYALSTSDTSTRNQNQDIYGVRLQYVLN